MTKITDFEFAGTISHGTMRHEDLVPAFLPVVKELVKWRRPDGADMIQTARAVREGIRKIEALTLPLSDDDAEWVMEWLFDTLDYLAPEGWHFGAHEGDGADYGFWQNDIED